MVARRWGTIPSVQPTDASRLARRPWSRPVEIVNRTPGPGTSTTTREVTRYCALIMPCLWSCIDCAVAGQVLSAYPGKPNSGRTRDNTVAREISGVAEGGRNMFWFQRRVLPENMHLAMRQRLDYRAR